MRFLPLILAITSVGLVCCSKAKTADCVADTLSEVSNITDSISDLKENGESEADKKILSEFSSVTDTLNSARAPHVHAFYFLHDITCDGKEELWINIGSCEADKELMAFTIDNGKPRKIYEGAGDHSDYFVYNDELVCVMCNCGEGFVITYKFNGKRVKDSMVAFSVWNDSSEPLSKNADADKKLDYWMSNPDSYIQLKSLSVE